MTADRAEPTVTVAVVSWNTRERLSRCLHSLAREHESGSAAIWVVDNRSTDGSPDLVREQFPWATLVEPGENIGFGAAVNLVAAKSSGEWIVPANADTAVAPGALATMLATGAENPRAAVIAPRLVLDDGATQHSVHPFPTVPFTIAFNLGLPRVIPGLADQLCLEGRWDSERSRDVPWAIGALLLIRRRAFDQVDGFDERHWMYAEDLDLGWRLVRAGWVTRYEPRAIVRHAGGAATSLAFGDGRRARFMVETYAWMKRERGTPRARAVAAINFAGAAVRLAGAALLAPISPRARARVADLRSWLEAHRQGLAG